MGKRERRRGGDGEREVARLLREALPGYTVQRRDQHEGGHDLRVLQPDGVPWRWALEVKRSKTWTLGHTLGDTATGEPSALWLSWWEQTVRQAEAARRCPLLVARCDRRPWWLFAHDVEAGCAWDHHRANLLVGGRPVGVWRLDDVLPVIDSHTGGVPEWADHTTASACLPTPGDVAHQLGVPNAAWGGRHGVRVQGGDDGR